MGFARRAAREYRRAAPLARVGIKVSKKRVCCAKNGCHVMAMGAGRSSKGLGWPRPGREGREGNPARGIAPGAPNPNPSTGAQRHHIQFHSLIS